MVSGSREFDDFPRSERADLKARAEELYKTLCRSDAAPLRLLRRAARVRQYVRALVPAYGDPMLLLLSAIEDRIRTLERLARQELRDSGVPANDC